MFGDVLFWLSALSVLVGSVMVVAEKNLMHACLFLLLTFLGVAGLYLTLNADFLAAIQLIVYAGGVVILMLFAIMLTGGAKARGMGGAQSYFTAGIVGVVMSVVVLFFFFLSLLQEISTVEARKFESSVEKIGELLLTKHVLAFEISSITLLGALIAAAFIARPRKSP